MAKYEHVIWDWNGTVLDDNHLNLIAINTSLKKHGIAPITLNYFREHLRFPLLGFYQGLGLDVSAESFLLMEEDFTETYDNLLPQEGRLQENVLTLFSQLEEQGAAQSILSARNHQSLLWEIAHFELGHFFTAVCGARHGKTYKGKTHYAKEVLRPETRQLSAVMIGDTTHDAEAAAALGADCVLVAKGANSYEVLLTAGVPVARDHFELADYLF